MRGTQFASIALWVAAFALLADSVRRGEAHVSLVVIVPVISGQSGEFLLGILLLVAGFLTLPWLLFETQGPEDFPEERAEGPSPPVRRGPNTVGGGGLLLIGPVPILFGGWRHVSRRTRWWLALAGGVLVVAFLAAVLFALR